MIRSCEDVKTENDFIRRSRLRFTLEKIGLKETSRMTRWSNRFTINPELLHKLTRA